MNLHIGGKEKKEGWKILNIQPGEHVDYLGDISNLAQFADASFEMIYASHVLEHVQQKDVQKTLMGIHRVLQPGGKFFISVPDWDILCHLFINPLASSDAKWHAMKMMLGGQEDQYDFHYVGFNQQILYGFLQESGFSDAVRVETFGLFSDSSDDKPYGFPISLNVVATR